MIMFDSLNRHMLPPYGCDWVKAPNFERLAKRTVTFDNSYVGSMPCMPARRELHTGRYNFLHRSWGPLEPFDDSMPETLRNRGIHTHLITDHQHYWEDGGATYHNRYSTYEFIRGQEGDKWMGQVADEPPQAGAVGRCAGWTPLEHQDRKNRKTVISEADFPQVQTMNAGLRFLDNNAQEDNWFLQLETFDPHEPYFVPERFKALYPEFDFNQLINDWPAYKAVTSLDRPWVPHMRYLNAAMISMCDHYLGKVLDKMDELNLWEDTLLIVNTDHGFLLGEHDWWAKSITPFYQEIAHTPLFVWDPRYGIKGERRQALVQNIDWAPTLLEFFGIERPAGCQGIPLNKVIMEDKEQREGVLFGIHGGHVNLCDGRYLYMRAPVKENKPLYNYTLLPMHMRSFFIDNEFKTLSLSRPLAFTNGSPVMKMAAENATASFKTMLFDLKNDPKQESPIYDPELETRMEQLMVNLMQKHDAPEEQFQRLALEKCLYNERNHAQ